MARKLVGVLQHTGIPGPQGKPGPQGNPGPPGPPGGVNSFNSRQGDVMPEVGDYSLGMVGAEMLTNFDIDELWKD